MAQDVFKDFTLKTDTSEFSLKSNTVYMGSEQKLAFRYINPAEVCKVIFSPLKPDSVPVYLLPSGDYSVIDTLSEIHR